MRVLVAVLTIQAACTRPLAPSASATGPWEGFTTEIEPSQEARCAGREIIYEEIPEQPGERIYWKRINCSVKVESGFQYTFSPAAFGSNGGLIPECGAAAQLDVQHDPIWRQPADWCAAEARRTERTVTIRQRRPTKCWDEARFVCNAYLDTAAVDEIGIKRASPLPRDVVPQAESCPRFCYPTTLETWSRLWRLLDDPVWRTANGGCRRGVEQDQPGRHLKIVGEAVRQASCAEKPAPAAWRQVGAAIEAVLPDPEWQSSPSYCGGWPFGDHKRKPPIECTPHLWQPPDPDNPTPEGSP